jgi:hypothetical protein
MKVFERIGSDPFTPSISLNSIVLNNVFTQVSSIPGSTQSSEITSNNINIFFELSNIKNNLLPIINDPNFLNYTNIDFIVFGQQQQYDKFYQSINQKQYSSNSISELAKSIDKSVIVQTLKLSNIPSVAQANQMPQTLAQANQMPNIGSNVFIDNIDPKQDIILVIIASLDFKAYYQKNDLTGTQQDLYDSIKEIYNIELIKYNVLVKNQIVIDQIPENNIVSDVRQINELNNIYLDLTNNITINTTFEEKPSYISDIFTSYDYKNNIIRSYFFFNIKKFITNSCLFGNVYNAHTIQEIESVLANNNCINIEVIKNNLDSKEQVCSFSTSYQTIKSANKNVTLINELTTDENICFSFFEEMPQSIKQQFNYTISVNYYEVFFTQYYNPSPYQNSGVYFDTLGYLEDVRKYITNTQNVSNSGTFINLRNAPQKSLDLLIDNLFLLFNLFSNTNIDNAIKQKIRNSLNFKTSTKAAHEQFIKFADNSLNKIVSIFTSFRFKYVTYSKNGNMNKFANNKFYFLIDSFTDSPSNPKTTIEAVQNSKAKYFVEKNNNLLTSYMIEPSQINEANPITYKIINSSLSLKNEQISYSSDYSNISFIFDSFGSTIKKTSVNSISTLGNSASTKSRILQNSSVTIDSLEVSGERPTDSTKETKSLIDDDKNSKITNIISNIELTNKINTLNNTIFSFAYLSNMNEQFLVPQYTIQIYDFVARQWKQLEISNNTKSKSYLARTIYTEGGNIYKSNNVVPPFANEYFIVDL